MKMWNNATHTKKTQLVKNRRMIKKSFGEI